MRSCWLNALVFLLFALGKRDMDLMKVLRLRCVPPLQSDLLISIALQLFHRLPEDLLYEIARHPFANPDAPTSLPFHPKTVSAIATQLQKEQNDLATGSNRTLRSSGSSTDEEPAAAVKQQCHSTEISQQTSCPSSPQGHTNDTWPCPTAMENMES